MTTATNDTKLSDTQIANHDMVVELYRQYQYDHIVAIRAASKIQRELSRAEHEVKRIERHMQRIEDFCTKHNVSLES